MTLVRMLPRRARNALYDSLSPSHRVPLADVEVFSHGTNQRVADPSASRKILISLSPHVIPPYGAEEFESPIRAHTTFMYPRQSNREVLPQVVYHDFINSAGQRQISVVIAQGFELQEKGGGNSIDAPYLAFTGLVKGEGQIEITHIAMNGEVLVRSPRNVEAALHFGNILKRQILEKTFLPDAPRYPSAITPLAGNPQGIIRTHAERVLKALRRRMFRSFAKDTAISPS